MSKRRNLPSKSKIVAHWSDTANFRPEVRITDLGEPSCWACGCYYGCPTARELTGKGSGVPLTREAILSAWNHASNLQRCHVVPRALGGSDTEDNLVLLCRRCHDEAPDTRDPEVFFRWVSGRDYFTGLRWFREESERWLDAWNALVGGPETYCQLRDAAVDFLGTDFWRWLENSDQVGPHLPQVNFSHAAILKEASLVAAWLTWVRLGRPTGSGSRFALP